MLETFVIVGPGAMGLLFAARLAASGKRVALLDYRPKRAAFLNQKGIRLRINGEEEAIPVPAFANASELRALFEPDAILFCVKAYATETAAIHARPLLGERTIAVTLQNGIGNAETVAAIYGGNRVLVGTTSEGATLLEEGVVRHAGRGTTRIGTYYPEGLNAARKFVDVLREAGFQAEAVSDWEKAVWAKAVVNAAINPLTAILRVPNGCLIERPETRDLLLQVTREAMSIAHACEVALPDTMPETVLEVCRATAKNRSSMLQDIEKGRRTELEHVNGVLLREAERLGVEAPVLRTVTQLVRALTLAAPRAKNHRS